MAKHLILLLVLCLVNTSLQDTSDNDVKTEDVNPFAEAASAILKEQMGQNIGSMVNNFIESGGAAQIGDVLSNLGKENAGKILEGLGSLMATEEKDGKGGDDGPNLIEGLGSLVGAAMQGAGGGGGDGAGALLRGLGSLLGGQGGQGGLDPAVLGSLVNMFANQNQAQPEPKKSKSSKSQKQATKVQKPQPKNEPDLDFGTLLSLASTFLGQGQKQGGQEANLLNLLPMVMQTINAFSGPAAEKRVESHKGHSWLLPPFLEKFHVMFDHFIHSDMGKYFINTMGAEKLFKVFTDEKGRFSSQKFVEMMENHSFRRHWIRMVTDKLVEFLQYVSDPVLQKTYLASVQNFVNTLLKSQGFPKSTLFDPAKPTETLSALVNHVSKKYFDVKIKSKEYVKPAVVYTQELLSMSQKNGPLGSGGNSRELSDKLADTINLEIIEPIARVSRAYRFAISVPKCDRYVLCLVNEENQNDLESLPGLKKLLYKGSSLLAAWFLSGETKTSFWTLYKDITEDTKCKNLYSEKCNDFHVEEIKVTTEYVHSEL